MVLSILHASLVCGIGESLEALGSTVLLVILVGAVVQSFSEFVHGNSATVFLATFVPDCCLRPFDISEHHFILVTCKIVIDEKTGLFVTVSFSPGALPFPVPIDNLTFVAPSLLASELSYTVHRVILKLPYILAFVSHYKSSLSSPFALIVGPIVSLTIAPFDASLAMVLAVFERTGISVPVNLFNDHFPLVTN